MLGAPKKSHLAVAFKVLWGTSLGDQFGRSEQNILFSKFDFGDVVTATDGIVSDHESFGYPLFGGVHANIS
ncbi:MAG: hypothetical protein U1D25_09190 [Hydrogenophaga sp.]|uniref:hypothetical protein n=1 Tax=Hydrogenophaga sp. TaxID=1904254 RepID=UPI002AB83FD5|nr:hypothetical protein [Hydrogenophaga sp.]MDZ4188264.1 hypothetical protein [Hydrogenophaga sp.]